MRFSLAQLGSPPVEGEALAHMEKNWGASFPAKWHWAQGINASTSGSARPEVRAAFSLAGGAVPSPVLRRVAARRVAAGREDPHPQASRNAVLCVSWRALKQMPQLPSCPAHLHPSLPATPLPRSWDMHAYNAVFAATARCSGQDATLLLTATQPLAHRAVEVQARALIASLCISGLHCNVTPTPDCCLCL